MTSAPTAIVLTVCTVFLASCGGVGGSPDAATIDATAQDAPNCPEDTECAAPVCVWNDDCTYADGCAIVGTRTGTCTPQICKSGACVAGVAVAASDNTGCGRNTDGTRCGVDSTTCDLVTACDGSDPCSPGSATYSCPFPTCAAGTCSGQGANERTIACRPAPCCSSACGCDPEPCCINPQSPECDL